MGAPENLQKLPGNLPVPRDDGAADHLLGAELPNISLPATSGQRVKPRSLAGRVVIYAYPMTGRPGVALPEGWNELPGARGCTPQACAFRDHHRELQSLGVSVFGLSTQPTGEQQEAALRLHLPFALLSDEKQVFTRALGLPAFRLGETAYLKRLTLIVQHGRIETVFYPVFPPDKNAEQVIEYVRGLH